MTARNMNLLPYPRTTLAPSQRFHFDSSTAICSHTRFEISASMASPMTAIQAPPVAGLASSSSLLLRRHSILNLQGPLKVSKPSRLGFAPIRAANLPRGVEPPRVEPKLPVPFWGFTENAEVWNSRASLIGLFGIVIVEAIIHRGLLQVIGVEVGKGLDLPL